jgi:hypothetical protein
MAKLTDAQLATLTRGAQQVNGFISPAPNTKGNVAGMAAKKLAALGLVQEHPYFHDEPWYYGDDETGDRVGFRLTAEGFDALGIDESERPAYCQRDPEAPVDPQDELALHEMGEPAVHSSTGSAQVLTTPTTADQDLDSLGAGDDEAAEFAAAVSSIESATPTTTLGELAQIAHAAGCEIIPSLVPAADFAEVLGAPDADDEPVFIPLAGVTAPVALGEMGGADFNPFTMALTMDAPAGEPDPLLVPLVSTTDLAASMAPKTTLRDAATDFLVIWDAKVAGGFGCGEDLAQAVMRLRLALPAAKEPKAAKPAGEPGTPKPGSKLAQVIALLSRKGGALAGEVEAATGWNNTSTRGFISSLRIKRGLAVGSRKEGGTTRYWIGDDAAPAPLEVPAATPKAAKTASQPAF